MPLYRGYDKEGLDAQYNLRSAVAEHPAYFERWARDSEWARRNRVCRPDLRYGTSEAERLDFFPAAGESLPAPLLLFIHGGYWRALDARDFGYLAPGFVRSGIAYASLNYGLAPNVDLPEIVRQCRSAVAWLVDNAEELGVDTDRICVAGHSAGGHLTAMMLLTDWPALRPDLPADLIKGGCAVSGVFDLEPMRLCFLNDDLGLDAAAVADFSPTRLVAGADRSSPLILAVGGAETAEFLAQQAEFAEAWRARGFGCHIVELPGKHHFSAVDVLAEGVQPLFRAVKKMVKGDFAGSPC